MGVGGGAARLENARLYNARLNAPSHNQTLTSTTTTTTATIIYNTDVKSVGEMPCSESIWRNTLRSITCCRSSHTCGSRGVLFECNGSSSGRFNTVVIVLVIVLM